MYRIMLLKSKRERFASLYQWLTQTSDDGEIFPVELETEDELDAKIEEMLNDGGYAKNDFIVVKLINYTIDAMDYDI